MDFLKKNRFRIAIAVVIVLGIGLLLFTFGAFKPVPDNSTFKSQYITFDYPRTYAVREYSAGEVSVGMQKGDMLVPYIEINRYQSDPDIALPSSFDAFLKSQAGALCGADGPVESITCTQIGETQYTSPTGMEGLKLDLTLVRKNLKTGTTTSSTYGPFYVFNTTAPGTPDSPMRYSAIFVYPSLPAFLDGTTTPELMQQIIGTLTLPSPASTVK